MLLMDWEYPIGEGLGRNSKAFRSIFLGIAIHYFVFLFRRVKLWIDFQSITFKFSIM